MSADTLIAALDGVRASKTKARCWNAKCPAHADKSPSLLITEKDDGGVLVHCFAGCSAFEIVSAVGLDIAELFPPKDPQYPGRKPIKRAFNAHDVLIAVASEATIACIIINELINGKGITPAAKDRLTTCAARLGNAESLLDGR